MVFIDLMIAACIVGAAVNIAHKREWVAVVFFICALWGVKMENDARDAPPDSTVSFDVERQDA